MLHKGKSKKTFEHNVETEMHHGHPLAQSLAIAYSMKRKSKKHHAHGGEHYAKGGEVDPYAHHHLHDSAFDHEEKASGYVGHQGAHAKHDAAAVHEDDKMLNQHGEHEKGPEGRHYAKGGAVHEKGVHLADKDVNPRSQHKSGGVSLMGAAVRGKHHATHPIEKEAYHENIVAARMAKRLDDREASAMTSHRPLKGLAYGGEAHPHESEAHELDMVGRIMKQRQHCYSHGGQVANDDAPFEYEFHTPDQFDELVKDDHLDFHYTGKNSGDELGDAREDHDRHDIVSRIMKSRKKHDRMPHLK